MQVAKELSNITTKMGLQWQRPESPIIVGVLHDICKTDDYTIKATEDCFEISWNKERYLPGHGDKSLMMIQQYCVSSGCFMITEEEAMCIRFHMGAFSEQKEWEFYCRAVKRFPNVLWTHTADMIASQIKDKQREELECQMCDH